MKGFLYMRINVVGHTSFLGHTGYNNHSRSFFTHLNKHFPTRIRNYTYEHDLSYLTEEQKHMIIEQTWDRAPFKVGVPFVKNKDTTYVNIVLNESHHYYFYDKYESPMIAYNVWEATKQIPEYFNRILEYDQFWCPTEWQRKCTIEQGYPEDRVKVVPEGVDGKTYYPLLGNERALARLELCKKYDIPINAFIYMVFGRWDYRKSIEEIVRTYYNKFKDDQLTYLVLSVDNPFPVDGMHTTEERLAHHGLDHPNIKVLHFPSDPEYVKWLQAGDCLVSCARSEGWNLPLIEAISCGIPTICSNFSGQLEFADGISLLVDVPKFKKPEKVFMLGDKFDIGVWGEPDFDHLGDVMVSAREGHLRDRAVKLSKYIREAYSWENAALKASTHIKELITNKYHYIDNKISITTKPKVSFVTSFYNAEKYIDDLYPTVLNQTFQNWEWIVTDDFSTDNTKEKVLELCKKDSRIKYIEQQFKREIYWNLHKYATGEYILTVDADDQLVPKTAEIIVHYLDNNADVSCIHTNANYYKDDFSESNFRNSSFCRFDKYKSILDKHKIYLENESGYERVGFLFGVVRAYRNPGPDFDFNDGDFKFTIYEDLVKMLRLEEMGKLLYLDRTLYKVRMHEDSESGSWGDKGGETKFKEVYETVNKRRTRCFDRVDKYELVREKLYPFLYSDLNNERGRKKVAYFDSTIDDKTKELIKEIYFDHDIYFNETPKDTEYIFVFMTKDDKIEEYYNKVQGVKNCKVVFFMVNDAWTPDFYKVEDPTNYFSLFNNVKNYLLNKNPFMFGSYLYKYCFIKMTTPERKKIRLNLGCGNDIRPGYINIDKYNNTGKVDLNCDINDLPFENETVDEIYLSHVFEHIGINDIYKTVEEWKRVLAVDGILDIRVPNLELEVKIWLNASDDTKWSEVHRIFGSQSHPGNTHLCGFNTGSLKWLLERLGLKVEKCETRNNGYGEEIQCISRKIFEVERIKPTYNVHFVDGPFVEVKGDPEDKSFYLIDILNPEDNSSVHQTTLGVNQWTRPHRKYFSDYTVRIHKNGILDHEHKFNAKDRTVLISFDSKSLGDSIAWIPYVEEFRKKHECKVVVSTFWNNLFEKHPSYSQLKFVSPGSIVNDIYASYLIGCYEGNVWKNKVDWRTVPLQKVAADTLGIEYKEIITDIDFKPGKRPKEQKYVTLSEFSTFQCKFWNYPNGWQTVIDYLNTIGYRVMVVSKEKTNLKNIINKTNEPLFKTMNNIYHSEFFMGVSAGPAWIAWALRKPVVMISGFSSKTAEFESNIVRIINENVCHGCFNDTNNNFERGDWNWCPRQKGTNRQFECTKTITPNMVIEQIKGLLT
jgi:autotransporter strand-loop-strand O-heptosyltransferase